MILDAYSLSCNNAIFVARSDIFINHLYWLYTINRSEILFNERTKLHVMVSDDVIVARYYDSADHWLAVVTIIY